ncbi:Maf family protein [Kordiimonas aestuarii]|uniref:Maf family protein n=1 Tax=Kordiimonas aestuarii TaxID=1005925 RepID=UPI0021D15783|nr:Maf family protein [Kordiimonas aestuarii]
MAELVLASGSKTRADMLTAAGVMFGVAKPMVDEAAIKTSLLSDGAPARDIADALADMKARSVSMMTPDKLVLGADQVIFKDGTLFSKAQTRSAATATLKALSGGTHELVSAAVVYEDGQAVWRAAQSVKLTMRPLSDDYISHYLDVIGEAAFWSAGAYQLEGVGAQLFTHVEGDFFTVLGLPLLPVLDFLRRREVVPV